MRHRAAGTESGQATLEFALLLPILALVLAAIVEIGMVVADQGRLWHAAREAVRTAVVDPDQSDVEAAAERGGLRPLTVTVDPPSHMRRQGDPLTVKLVHEPRARVPLFDVVLDRIELRATATMRIEQP